MKARFSIPFSRLVMALFAFGLIGTAIALFWITHLGSLSIAEHEIARSAKSKATLARLVFTQHLDQLETQIRTIAANPDIRAALKANDKVTAKQIVERASEGLTSAVLDILLIDHSEEPGWVNGSLGLIDIRNQLPSGIRAAMPPDIWVTYANHSGNPVEVTAAMSTPVLDPVTGLALGKIYGGTTVTDSFSLPGVLAKILKVEDLALYHDNHVVAGLGDLTTEDLPPTLLQTPDSVSYMLKEDHLYVYAPLMQSLDGHMMAAVVKQPVDTLQKVEETYSKLFTPFLLYTAILAIGAAFLVNRITSAGLGRLLSYAMSLRQDRLVSPPSQGFITEFNKLASMFQAAFEAMRERDAQFKDMIDGSLHGVLVHANHRILYVNDALLQTLGYQSGDPSQLVGAPTLAIYAPEERDRLNSYYNLRDKGGAPRAYEVKGLRKDGTTVWLEQHVRITEWRGENAFYATISDISERKRQEELATKNANFDILTGLPNRRLLMDRLRQAIQRSKHFGELTALMILDLDRFKTVNDTYGPKAGDCVIEAIAARLTETLGADQTVARMGGDEFAIILSNPEDRWQIEQCAKDILAVIAEPITLDNGARIVMDGSLGITLTPNDGTDDEALLLQADTSMFQAKTDSGSSYRFFATRMNEQTARAGQIEISLRQALEKGALHLNYQPIVDYSKNRVVSCECLARWNDPQLGTVTPAEFIKIAEECGLIIPLGEWVLREACGFYHACNRNGLQLDAISVNISPRQCRDAGFLERLKAILADMEMDPARLQLEITENVMFDDQRVNPIEILESISELGIKISLDDFGTGFSSLNYLKRLPIDTLKIDRSFIMGLERDKDGQALVQAIISMAHSLGIEVVCEGAETQEQCDLIQSFGCSYIQGYSLARPMPGVDFQRFLAETNGIKSVAVRAG
ncbi:putative bifunctional diguanylate cyclase/phosphodiesterase [Roseibium sp. Sym1]|uniref:putative bifunctional diguanylate cyclase/phosphodiesterase n=1 Tax=Roseibium sp. Sym1 TaxID=3016006 RepID=UPI0022B3DDC1|nr:EAL domain-containing protein [Roseibium sp. Sym1]